MSEILILAGARTPFATWAYGKTGTGAAGGAYKELDAFDLGAAALRGALARASLTPADLGYAVFGNMYQIGAHGCYNARLLTNRAGCPNEVPGMAVGLACGTGLQTLATAAEAVARGEAPLVAAVAADCPSRVRRDVFVPSFIDPSCGMHIAKTAEARAQEKGLTRQDMDAWALRSHTASAGGAALRAAEIVPLSGLSADDAVLEAPTPEHFAQSKPLFEEGPRLLAHANIHGVADGGAALILAAPKAAKGRALGRVVSTSLVGVPPEQMAFAAIPAVRKALEKARWRVSDVELWEIHETFAAQILLDCAGLGIPQEKLNVRGGSIALGHPFAATGLRLVLSLLLELPRRGGRRGAAAVSVGGGLGIAACVEAL